MVPYDDLILSAALLILGKSTGEDDMRAFLASVAVAFVVAVGAMFVLDAAWRPADQAFATSGARVGDAGDNLVGKDWYSSRRF
jgi:hypothetical protein